MLTNNLALGEVGQLIATWPVVFESSVIGMVKSAGITHTGEEQVKHRFYEVLRRFTREFVGASMICPIYKRPVSLFGKCASFVLCRKS